MANPKKGNDKFEFRKRIRFGMSKKTVKALLEDLNACTSICWSCSCKDSHCTSLQLEHRDNLYASNKSRLTVKKTSFRVSFSSLQDDSKASWRWQPAEISVEEEEEEEELSHTPLYASSCHKNFRHKLWLVVPQSNVPLHSTDI